MIYLWTLVISIIIAYLIPKNLYIRLNKKKKNIAWIICAIPIFMVSSLRYNVGIDYLNYTNLYYRKAMLGSRTLEPLFSVIIDFANYLSDDAHSLIVIFAFLFCFFVYKCMYESCCSKEEVLLSITVLFASGTYFYSLCMIRQMFCCVLFLFSINYYNNGKYIKTCIFIMVAIFIHNSSILYALFFIGVFLLQKLSQRINKNKIRKYLLDLLPIIYILSNVVRDIIAKILLSTGSYYKMYFNSIHDAGNISYTYLLMSLVPLLLMVISINYQNSESSTNEIDEVTVNRGFTYYCSQWYSCALAVLLPVIPNGERLIYMFLPICIIALPFYYSHTSLSRNKKELLFTIGILLMSVLSIRFFVINDALDILPFHWIWNR